VCCIFFSKILNPNPNPNPNLQYSIDTAGENQLLKTLVDTLVIHKKTNAFGIDQSPLSSSGHNSKENNEKITLRAHLAISDWQEVQVSDDDDDYCTF
jgi:hypothetical protein